MHVETLRKILADKARAIGQGRFHLSIESDAHGAGRCFITHWFRRDDYAFEDCNAVGVGTLADCLDALEAYRGHPGHRKMVDGDLNLVPARSVPVAAE